MARLPDIAVDTPRGERPTTRATVNYGDLGLGRIAEGIGEAAQAYDKARTADAEDWAGKTLADFRIDRDTRIAERVATYDGAEPGLARSVLEESDAAFAAVRETAGDPVRRAALQDAYDGWRTQQGGNLSQIEAGKRAEPLRLQRQAAADVELSTALFGLDADFRTRQAQIEAAGGDTLSGHGAASIAAWDAATAAAVEAAPEALRARLAAKAAAKRLDVGLGAAEAEEKAGDARMATAAQANLDTVTNSLLSNPAGYREAAGLIPTITATLPAALRPKFEAEAKGVVAGAFVQGLINRGLLGHAQQQLSGGTLDTVLDPKAKQGFLNQIEVAERVAARVARGRNSDSDDDDSGLGGAGASYSPAGVGGLLGKPFDNTKAGFATDPIEYAVGDKKRPAMAPVAPMDPNQGVAEGGAPAWGAALQQRRALGIELSKGFGVPQRMLTNAEQKFFADALERDPAAGVRLASNAREAIGAAGAQQLMREVGLGGSAPAVTLHIADMAAAHGDSFASKASKGLTLMTAGEKPTATETAAFDREFGSLAGVTDPQALLAAKQTAVAAWVADRANGVAATPDFYARRALGGTSYGGNSYGGRATVNGATTLLPGWLNPRFADDALGELGKVWAGNDKGPRFENGKPMTAADIARRGLKLAPNGWYMLVNKQTGGVAVRANGQPFMFDLDRDRGFLAKRLGAAGVLGAK